MASKKSKAQPMKVIGKAYSSVADLVRDTSDTDFADDFDQHLSDRRLVKGLTVLRCTKDLSQAELAERMGCGQPKVSKIESSVDADLNFGDILSYARSLEQSVQITLMPARVRGVDHIRFLLSSIKHELDRLVKVAGDEKRVGDGVEAFAIETVHKMIEMIEESISKLPDRAPIDRSPVCVEVEGDRGERLSLDAPSRARRSSRKVVPTN